jgi:alkanesulfonate monooxygenase SsuD/methylene tetrahydromethanopterin reductase-like flavin-dependent oxidoreductase (luciferase family)
MKLSIIDLSWPGDAKRLVQEADSLGYDRFWTTEHHSLGQSASPIVLSAALAAVTSRIRIGTAGVMLQYYSPFKIVEDFQLLETLFPGRIDLGLIGGTMKHSAPIHRALMDGRAPLGKSTYRRKFTELMQLLRRNHHLQTTDLALPGPITPSSPAVWLCSSSPQSAEFAGKQGVGFIYHAYLAQAAAAQAVSTINVYRENFNLSHGLHKPVVAVACYGYCAEKERTARAVWREFLKASSPSQNAAEIKGSKPSFIGTPQQCREQLEKIGAKYGVSELVIQCLGGNFNDRLGGYRLLAKEFRLKSVVQSRISSNRPGAEDRVGAWH